jgi:hypothetical protein
LRNDEGDKLSSGILMNLDSPHMYTSFLSLKERPIDVEIISANTYLSYDKRTSSFVMQGEDSLSNIFTINENTCKSYAEGIIDLNMDFGQLKVKSIGFANRDERNNRTELQMFLMLDFMFNKKALSIMAEDIFEAYGVTDFVFGEFYSKTLARIVGKGSSKTKSVTPYASKMSSAIIESAFLLNIKSNIKNICNSVLLFLSSRLAKPILFTFN